MKFSSQVRQVPQGVMPLAQLLKVPSTRRPCGSKAVLSSAWPAAGPPKAIGVAAVMRRAQGLGRTTSQRPCRSATSMTERPCAACDLRTFCAVQVFMPSGCSRPSSTYSWLITSSPEVEPTWAKNCMPS